MEQNRGDYNGRVLSVRAENLRSRATLYDRSEVSAISTGRKAGLRLSRKAIRGEPLSAVVRHTLQEPNR